ncbi:sarcosine oxidase subunit delta [Loktanella sp. DJP18]|uniref:sarcosine oxidase subunit delta n=1 Tax=Loktanella sp. DJP18 TaxID=3409788 RepID=UPI003BB79B80
MRLACPLCGIRDRREFTYQGSDVAMARPARDAGAAAWDDYLHNRDNVAGAVRDLWQHDPCGAWLVVDRNTVSHAIGGSALASEVPR